MYRYISAHHFIDYNANPRGTNTGDCQTRAIAMAFGITWDEARKRLRSYGHDLYNRAIILQRALKEEFDCSLITIDPSLYSDGKNYLTIGEFCDTIGKEGTYLIACGPKDGRTNHLVCTINGTVYDTWDSSYQRVFEVYKPNGQHATEGIGTSSDIPDHIYSIAVRYEEYFNDLESKSDFMSKLKSAIPSLDDTMVDYISKRLSFSAYCEYEKMHGFNFVMDIQGRVVGMLKLKKKSYNVVFDANDTYADALARKESIVSNIYNNYCDMLIRQFKTKLSVTEQPNNLRNTRISQTLLKAYQKIDNDVRDVVVNMESFCGYIGAVLTVGTEESPFYVMALCKSVKYLNESIRICLKQSYDYWSDYHTPNINVLPHGFAMKLRKYDYTYSGDKKDFKEFIESYDEYLYNIEHNEGNDIDYYFSSWHVPEFLT